MSEPLVLSRAEAAKALGVGMTRLNELTHTKGFPAIRIGSRVVFPVDQLRRWIAQQPTVSGYPLNETQEETAV
jgi:excisionase family DNA binding protein